MYAVRQRFDHHGIARPGSREGPGRFHGGFGDQPSAFLSDRARACFTESLGLASAAHGAIPEAHTCFGRIGSGDPDPARVAYFDEPKLIVDTGNSPQGLWLLPSGPARTVTPG
ncbi:MULTISPECIES: hypothetical protein [unclassified Streptomyces]|uniref:hypothetical protein n=1 Tax=unclassified Streptomyces TaxID=2593676 RepID=UPI0038002CFD